MTITKEEQNAISVAYDTRSTLEGLKDSLEGIAKGVADAIKTGATPADVAEIHAALEFATQTASMLLVKMFPRESFQVPTLPKVDSFAPRLCGSCSKPRTGATGSPCPNCGAPYPVQP